MTRNRLFNIEYCTCQGIFWMAFCSVVSYAALFLQRRGYSSTETGAIMAAGNILALLLQPTVAAIADRSRRLTLMGIISAIAGVMICGMATVFLAPGRSFVVSISYGLYFCSAYLILPFVNAFSDFLNTWGLKVNFGIARGVGSLAYALLTLVLGMLIEKFGPNVLPITGIIFTVCLLIMMALFTRQYSAVDVKTVASEKGRSRGLFTFLRSDPRFALLLLGLALSYFSHSSFTNFLINVVENVGGGSAEMGVCSAIAAVVELPPMFLFMILLRRWRCSTLLTLSCIMFPIKMLACCFSTNVGMLYAVQVIQMLAFGLYIPASVQYVNEVVAPADRVKGQALVTSTSTLSAIVSSLCCGLMIDRLGVSSTMLLSAGISVVGAIVVIPTIRKTPIHREKEST